MNSPHSVVHAVRSTGALDVERIRADFPILGLKVNGKPLVFLDNAASSQMPQQVIDRLVRYQTAEHANIHRGVHYLSETATAAYEGARAQDPALHQRQRRARDHFYAAAPPIASIW